MTEQQPKTSLLIAMAGLPGTGKSSIANRLAAELPGYVILDGRTYTKKLDVNSLVAFAASINS